MISLRMTLLRRRQLEETLQSQCSNIFRSFLGYRPKMDQEARVVTPPTIDTKEALRAMQLEGFLANHPALDGAGVKIGAKLLALAVTLKVIMCRGTDKLYGLLHTAQPDFSHCQEGGT